MNFESFARQQLEIVNVNENEFGGNIWLLHLFFWLLDGLFYFWNRFADSCSVII